MLPEEIEAKIKELHKKAQAYDDKAAVWMMRANDIREIAIPRLSMKLKKMEAGKY